MIEIAVYPGADEHRIARRLIAEGADPDQPWQTRWPDGRIGLRGRSLRWLAETMVVEGDRDGLRRVKYRPMDYKGRRQDGAEGKPVGEEPPGA